MNAQFLQDFVKQATAAGLSVEQAEDYIRDNLFGGKTAEQITSEFAEGVLASCGLLKSAEAEAYITAFAKQAAESNLDPEQIAALTKAAVELVAPQYTEIFQRAPFIPGEAQLKLACYFGEGVQAAAAHGIAPADALNYFFQKTGNVGQELLLALQQEPALLGALLGGTAGATSGYLTGEEDSKGSNAALQGLLGATLGGAAGGAYDMFKQPMQGGPGPSASPAQPGPK